MSDLCRNCKNNLPGDILLSYSNMPKSAQFFPTADEVGDESGIDIILRQCPYCGLVQASGTPVSYYRDVIRAVGVSSEMGDFRKKQYKEWVDKYNLNNRKVIERGCGRGEYMQYMERTGAQVYGLEHLHESVEKGRKDGHNIIEGFLEDESYVIEGGPYDGFYIMNFLEHIPDPAMFMRAIRNNLSDEAYGIVEVPNFDMMISNSLYSEFIQDHLSYFTIDTLETLLKQNGFEVIETKAVWYDYIISAVVRKRTRLCVDDMNGRQSMIKKQVKEYIDTRKKDGKTIAVWGAGHQALANLSLLDMAGGIECVLDSAKFKQNHYTPATHIPVVGPDKLKEGKIDYVIIMAGSYSDEIAGIIQREYPKVGYAIMRDDGLEIGNDN